MGGTPDCNFLLFLVGFSAEQKNKNKESKTIKVGEYLKHGYEYSRQITREKKPFAMFEMRQRINPIIMALNSTLT